MPTESSWQAVTRQAAARYFTIQGSAGVAWWALLYLYPESHNWFFPDTLGRQAIRALALPDLLTFVAGLLQGAAVGVWLGSPLVLIYVLTGGLIWDAVVRPLEEHDLQLRFTDAYLAYQKRVRCWLPKLRPGRAR